MLSNSLKSVWNRISDQNRSELSSVTLAITSKKRLEQTLLPPLLPLPLFLFFRLSPINILMDFSYHISLAVCFFLFLLCSVYSWQNVYRQRNENPFSLLPPPASTALRSINPRKGKKFSIKYEERQQQQGKERGPGWQIKRNCVVISMPHTINPSVLPPPP